MIDTAIILAAGLGKRMRDFDPAIPKPLIKVNSKPFIQYSIDLLNEIKTKEIIINVHYKSDEILKFIKSLSQTNIIVSDESDLLLDTGGGIRKIFDKYNINKFPTIIKISKNKVKIFNDTRTFHKLSNFIK